MFNLISVLPSYTLSSSERLKSRKTIEKLFSEGDSLFVHPLKLLYTKIDQEGVPPLQFGITVPKRLYKSAVARNRIKRLVREAYRLQKPAMLSSMPDGSSNYALMYIYVHKEEMSVVDLKSSIKRLYKRWVKAITTAIDAQPSDEIR